MPDGDGTVALDVNKTLNTWFAFTAFATCPAPIAGNGVTVPVLASKVRISRHAR